MHRRERYVVVEAFVVRRRGLLILLGAGRALLPWLPIWHLARLLALRSATEQLHLSLIHI